MRIHRIAGVLTLVAGCRSQPTTAAGSSSVAAVAGEGAGALLHDELWRASVQGDAADWARLADREGALGLLEALQASSGGSSIARAALHALPWCEDWDLSLGGLAELGLQQPQVQLPEILDALDEMLFRRRVQVDVEDREGGMALGGAIAALSHSVANRELRARAVSIGRELVDRGWLDRQTLASDLDPP